MSSHFHNELRKEFQLERLILFSDAVFAIAITLLVIEIKIPEVDDKDLSEHLLLYKLGLLIPRFVGFLISFLIIGQYWVTHHRMFGFVINFSDRLIWLNLIFLLCIALMPFSTGFYSEYAAKKVLSPAIFYTANITGLGLLNFLIWRYISNPKNEISENLKPPVVKYYLLRSVTVPAIFIIFSIVYFFSPTVAVWIPALIPVAMRFFYRSLKKKIITYQKQ